MSEKRVSVRFYSDGAGKLRAEFKGIGDAGVDGFDRISKQADATGKIVQRAMGLLATVVSVGQLARYADTWTDLTSRVNLATGSQEMGAAVMGRLGEMARRTYSSLEQTTESYLANATALRELGMSTRESLDFTESLNNALVVSGARQERARQVSDALSKAMALGTLSGDNLNSVIQAGGRVAELLAAELGVNVNQLRALGSQGVITGDVIRRALVGNLELLRAEAESMPATIGDAFTLLGNAALELVGTWDQVLQASASVSAAIIFLGDNLERIAIYAATFAGVMGARYVAAVVAAQFATWSLTGALVALRGALLRTGIGVLIVGAGELIYWFGQIVRGAGGIGNAMVLLGQVGVAAWREIGNGGRALLEIMKAVGWGIAKAFTDAFKLIFDAWDTLINSMLTPFNMLMDAVGSEFRLQAVSPIGTMLGEMSAQFNEFGVAAAQRAGQIFDSMTETRAAVAALVEAIKGINVDDGALDGVAASAAKLEDALNRAGGAAQKAGRDGKIAAEQAATGWAAAADAVRKYAEMAGNWGKGIGDALTGAFTSAENAFSTFVQTGKMDFKSLARSILADLSMIATRRFILGPIANALGGIFGGVGAPLNAMGRGPLASFDGGGHTGYGARAGGLDGRGGFLALMHPRETVIDETRGQGGRGGAVYNIDARGAQEGVAEQIVAALRAYDREMLPVRVAQISRDPRARGR